MRVRPFRRPGFHSGAVRRFCFALIALLLTAPLVLGDIQQPPRAHAPGERRVQRRGEGPAIALSAEALVEQGGTVVIVLHADGQIGKSLDFQVRTRPQHGTITGGPSRISRNSESVVYNHTPGDDATDDEFTFCVQAPGSALSAPETVHVRIVPSPPLLVASPGELDFGAVKAGDSARAQLTLENRGGSETSGVVSPPAPWVVEGSPGYRLGRGASQTFQIVFRPREEQAFTENLHFQHETGGGVRLVGTGLADPTRVVASKVAEAPASDVGSGDGSLTLFPAVSASPPPPSPAPAIANASAKATLPDPVAAVRTNPNEQIGPLHDLTLGPRDQTAIPLNEAMVKRVDVRSVGSSTVDLAWKPPDPKPASYRVELRYLSMEDDKVRLDWRPYALVEVNAGRDEVTAHLRGLPSTGLQFVRVVAVDHAGRLSSPSPLLTLALHPPSTWWHPTLLKVLAALLLVCGGLVLYKRWEDQQMLQEIDASRRRSNAEAGIAWKH